MTITGMLPIGTVVLLKDSTKRVMITGIAQYSIRDDGSKKLYDYAGVVFPEGYLSSDSNYLFNRDQIDKLFFIGLQDTESMTFCQKAEQALDQLRAEN